MTTRFLARLAKGAAGLAACWIVGAGPAAAQDHIMTIAHLYPETIDDNEVAPALLHFKQLVETWTDGAVEVAIFGSGALGSEVETAKQAQRGLTVQSVIISSGAMSSFYKPYQIVATPFLFPDYQVAWTFFDSPWFAAFMSGVREQSGLRYLGTLDDGGGFVAFTNNRRLITKIEDIEGLNIRVEENPAHVAIMRALGASATPLPWGEVATALATGLADGQFNTPTVSRSFKLWEVNDYTTWSGHVYNTLTWLVSEAWFEELPEAHRRAIVRAARESVAMAHGIAALMSTIGWQESCRQFEACHVLSPAERARMDQVTRPAFKDWITNDFGIPAADVEALWAEVERIDADLDSRYGASYLQ